MFKMGGFYLTDKGRLVKLFNQFGFQDGYVINAAIYIPNQGWQAMRYKLDGTCNVDNPNNFIRPDEKHDSYSKYLNFNVYFNRTNNSWSAFVRDLFGANIVELNNIENRERAMSLAYLGAEQKVLTWMREAGYDEDTVKETIDATA